MRNKLLTITLAGMILLGLTLAFSTNISAKDKTYNEGQTTVISGVISVKGSMPKIYLSLTTDQPIVYRLDGRELIKIQNKYQGNTLKLKGIVRKKARGPGFPALFEIYEILKVEPK